MLTEAERHRVLVEWNDTGIDYPRASCLHELIEAQVERTPESMALLFEGQKLSYREMNARANQLAHHLQGLGVGPDVPVGLCLERSLEMILGLMGILKAGGAYVPLDPAYPRERLAFMLADARVPVLLTQQHLLGTLPASTAHVLCLDPEWWASTRERPENPVSGATPGNLAYVIYTSGSTGQPKGVQVEHRGLTNLVETQFRVCRARPGDRVLQFCSLSFDPSIFEIGLALRPGATLVLARQSSLMPGPALAQVLRDQAVTTIVLPPSVLSPLPDGPFPALRTLVVGAEPVTAEFVKRWGNERHIFNIYGATETTVFSTIAGCRADGSKPSIGRPIANTQIYLLDSRLEPVPIGEPGELYVGGVGVARGYLNRPELTAERFLPDRFGNVPGGRLYRTGDMARYLPDGSIDFLGRVDNQVKVRGHRIELEEIEAILTEHSAVRECAVTVRPDVAGAPRLVAYLVPAQGSAPAASEIRGFLRGRLPDYMVPGTFLRMETLPLSPNGKVDRKALPAPEPGVAELAKPPYEAPRTRLDSLLTQLWQKVLGLDKVGVNDNFFDGGGDSLKAAVLLNELQELLGEYVYVVALFDAPTVTGLAAYLRKRYPEAVSRLCGSEPICREDSTSKTEGINPAKVAQLRQLIRSPAPLKKIHVATAIKSPAIFILSPPRSGSTLLRVMLAGHPGLFAPPELELLGFETLEQRTTALSGRHSFWLQGTIRAIMEIKGCDAETAQEIMRRCEARRLTTQEFYLQMQEWMGERKLVDKSTNYALNLETLQRAETYFEKPLYIHLFRHPCGMIRSFEQMKLDQLFRYDHPFSGRGLAELVWLIGHQNILEFLSGVPEKRRHRVRFEDLVTEPEEVMEQLCEFLGLALHPDMLKPYEHSERRMTDDLHGLSRMLGDLSFHRHSGIDPNVAHRWKQDGLDSPLSDITWRVAESLGYENLSRPNEVLESREFTHIPVVLRDSYCNGYAELPLSFAQQRLWFLDQLQTVRSSYHSALAIRMEGVLDTVALQHTLEMIVSRHASLRTTFAVVEESPIQVISKHASVAMPVTDLTQSAVSERDAQALRLAAQEAQQPFDLTHGPLLRAHLVRLGERKHLLLLTIHHIVSDGWSVGVLIRELVELYPALCAGNPSPLPDLPIEYADFAVWQRQWLRGDFLERQLSYWKRQLLDAPATLPLPIDHPRPALESFRGAAQSFTLPRALTDTLHDLSRQEGVTLFMTLLAGFQTLLHRYTAQEDIAVGTPVANRNRRETEGLIGFFVNTLVLRTRFSGDPTFRELLGRVREVTRGAYAHQDLPFEMLVDKLQPMRDLGRNPLFQVMFILQNAPMPALELPNLTTSLVEIETGTAKFDLTLHMSEARDGLSGKLEYNTDLFDAATIGRMLEHFRLLLEGSVHDPEQRVSRLPLLAETELRQLLVEWNDTQADYPRTACIHHLFEAQVQRAPEAVAVQAEDGRLTYSELNRKANQLAQYLRKLGVTRGASIGICMERSSDMTATLLGILKAGGAFVALDPADPPERLAFVLKDADVKVLLTRERWIETLPKHGAQVICLDSDWPRVSQESTENPAVEMTPDDLAYIIYTSGSTGQPKGVLGLHRGAVNRFAWMWKKYPFEAGEVACLKTSLDFVDSIWEIFGPLLAGVRIVVIPDGVVKDPHRLITTLAAHRVTRLVLVPSLLRVLLDADRKLQRRLPCLRYWVSSGEALSADLVRRFKKFMPESILINLYGSSEVSADVTCYDTRDMQSADTVPVGRPIANTQIYILDSHQQPVALGVPGELHVGGDGLARGYLNRPGQTAEKFIPNPFISDAGGRLYRTGDRGRYRPDGNIELLSRMDNQVKLRGFRIELGEVENALGQHPLVRENVTAVRDDKAGEKILVAYVVPREAQEPPTTNELRSFLRSKLPGHMVPSAFVIMDKLPLTPSGKVERRALSAPDHARPDVAAFVAPRNATESQLAKIWERTLGIQSIGVTDDFFELGGHSLLAVTLFARIQKTFGKDLPLAVLFQHSTIEELAAILTQEGWAAPRIVELQPGGSKPPFFCVHETRGYRELAAELGPDQAVYVLPYEHLFDKHTERPLTDLAEEFIEQIRSVQPEGPYFLGGMCLAGHVALAIAQKLHAQGEEIGLLAVFDARGPDAVTPGAGRIRYMRERIYHHLPNLLRRGTQSRLSYVLKRLKNLGWGGRAWMWSISFKLYQVMGRPLPRALRDPYRFMVQAVYRSLPTPAYPGRVTLFLTAEHAMESLRDPGFGWNRVAAGGLEIHEVPGDHTHFLHAPNVAILGQQLQACLRKAQAAECATESSEVVARHI